MWQIALLPKTSDVTIMLLGSTGAGKSASGNTIIGRDKYSTFAERFSPESVTKVCRSANTEVEISGYKQTISVIDTVGLSDIDVKISEAKIQIEKTLNNIDVDVFLLVIRLGDKFTEVENKVMDWIQNNLGAKIFKRTIVLFTHGDELCGPVERYLNRSKTLGSIIHQCFGRYHVFNNRNKDKAQVSELLEKINRIKMLNGETRYTRRDYRQSQNHLHFKNGAILAVLGAVFVFMVSSELGGGKVAYAVSVLGWALLALAAFFALCFLAGKKD